jgi:endonuclease/exonuclease/phosphatase family metal-dependent hydrolase
VAIAVAIGLGLAVAGCMATFRWHPDGLGPSTHAVAPTLSPGELRAVTFNAFRLSQTPRVPGTIGALRTSAALLARSDRELPELITLQEIESRDTERALTAALERTHWVGVCECATEGDGTLRSAVALAIDRGALSVESHRCVALGREWPDHPRCAVEAEVRTPDGRGLRVIGVHLAWHYDNAPMAQRLRAALAPALARHERVLVMGDFNMWPDSDSHVALSAPPLRDARPGAPPTHFTGERLDYLFYGPGLSVVRGLDRRASYDALRPASSLAMPDACARTGPPDCPVSDHLPEGAVLRLGGS